MFGAYVMKVPNISFERWGKILTYPVQHTDSQWNLSGERDSEHVANDYKAVIKQLIIWSHARCW
jgi:hypothetical protein